MLLDAQVWGGRLYTGEWTGTGRTAQATEPATGTVLGEVATADADMLHRCAATAADAGRSWAASTHEERGAVLRRAAALFEEHREEIGRWLMREAGKTSAPAEMELAQCAGELREAAALTSTSWGALLPTTVAGRTSLARRVPMGVVAVIAPWNFPLVLALRSVAPALATGNAVLLKPASETAVCCGVVIARLFEEAGLPAGVLQMLPGRGSELGDAVAEDPHIDMISFTGSTPVGKKLAESAGRNLKKIVCELGGNNPFVVLDDADVEAAAAAGAFGSFLHQGQICMAVGRHLVAEPLADAYAEALAGRVRELRVGDPVQGADLGPVINEGQADHAERLVRETVRAGARQLTEPERDGLFLRPTVLSGVTEDMPAYREEIFGPVATVTSFADEEEAVRLANDTPYGLVAAVHSGSAARAEALGDRLRAGMIHLNDQTVNDETLVPFGGRDDSGGGGHFGAFTNLDEFTTWQWVTVHRSQTRPRL
ncbi:aldehyde dehydrogenase family protein [Streptomyces sp. JJ36]|uniref:aldehyde dehydrogenase family protein n=1 Tax=Streptomyces sp. JJ36 TaxID=2736645 RepID=UPI001F30E15C|nr:aldehyde dehydrogenase family protein [Streptomyces sp. JJ36]MCF6524788.1 aldehyde dehydrogenase family protein [Streptomyces sp. JJ36]